MPKISKKARLEKSKTAQVTALAPYKFPKGVSGNAKGRPKTPEDIKKARKYNQVELERLVNKYLYMSVKALRTRKNREDLQVADKIVVNMLLKALEDGDFSRLEWISKRIIGRVGDIQRAPEKPLAVAPNQTQVNIQNQIPGGAIDINSLTVEQLEELGSKIRATQPKLTAAIEENIKAMAAVKINIPEKSALGHEPLSWLSDDLEI